MSDYVPGTCNIGERERRRRYRVAYAAFALAAAYVLVVAVASVPAILVIGAFAPLSLGVEWYVQGREAFCVRLAWRGAFSFGGDRGSVSRVDARRRDRRHAAELTVISLAAAAVLTGLVYAAVATV
ncbi:hypothetical protein [Salarchaeum sp. JOR-1]|uniref:hypothetical protein n=1 Tax=Salarchaeum sp. JOR-1 TaxID=2599399 RepID=UPI0011987770|nr:hypothetical protein [Salarchaeum sp. JOR-1]QDX41081.1 hypothetical protein FQU85_09285 [Salarchaeum sp. JOR-1]